MGRQKIKILVVSSQEEQLDFIESVLSDSHHTIVFAKSGPIALKKIFQEPPDFIILDMDMPKVGGEEIRERLKRDVLYRHIPILKLTSSKKKFDEETHGAGASDHETLMIPFESDELLTRVRGMLSRTARDLDANPITRLPGNASYLRELDSYIHHGKPFVQLTLDVANFTAFNERYGLAQGDEVIYTVARILLEVARVFGNETDFVGHFGADDFVMITTPDKSETLASQLVTRFDECKAWFYDEADHRNGWISVKDRRGRERKYPLMALAIAGVNSSMHTIRHAGEVSKMARELMQFAKTAGRSIYIMDRRSTLEPAAAR